MSLASKYQAAVDAIAAYIVAAETELDFNGQPTLVEVDVSAVLVYVDQMADDVALKATNLMS